MPTRFGAGTKAWQKSERLLDSEHDLQDRSWRTLTGGGWCQRQLKEVNCIHLNARIKLTTSVCQHATAWCPDRKLVRPQLWEANPRAPRGNLPIVIWVDDLNGFTSVFKRNSCLYNNKKTKNKTFCPVDLPFLVVIGYKTRRNPRCSRYTLKYHLAWSSIWSMKPKLMLRSDRISEVNERNESVTRLELTEGSEAGNNESSRPTTSATIQSKWK